MSVVKGHWVVNPANDGTESCEFTGGLEGETRGVLGELEEGVFVKEILEYGPKVNQLLQMLGLRNVLKMLGLDRFMDALDIDPEAVLRIGVWSE